MKKLLLLLFLTAVAAHAQEAGQFEGYDGEWAHVSRQLLSLAQATPADKFAWRPAPGVRSTAEVYMHIAAVNFYLLSVTGLSEPKTGTVTDKTEVIDWLRKSLEAVKVARAHLKPGDLQHKVKIYGKEVTVDSVYLRLIVHDNEHMGQAIAYARMNGIVPPWSK